MMSKSLRKLVRRIQFAGIVARQPRHAKAAYDLVREPKRVDPITLGGLCGSDVLRAMMKSPLLHTGNVHVPIRIAMHLYLHEQRDQSLDLLRHTYGSDARMLEAELRMYSGDIAWAMALFSAAADRAATKIPALKNVALCHYLEGNIDVAIDTVILASATYPRDVPLMTLFSRLVRRPEEVDRYLNEKSRLAKHGFSASSSAQLVRVCGRAGAKSRGEAVASDAIINLCATGSQSHVARYTERTATGAPKGQYTSGKGHVILEHVAKVAEAASLRLFLMGGTLLGVVRDKALLAWDKDLDFGCFSEEASISDLWQVFSDNPYFIPMGTVEDRLIKLRHISGVTVDIFVNFLSEGIRWHGGQFVFWRDKAFRLREIMLPEGKLYVPDDPEAYLRNHYGEGWDRPDPHFDVFWEGPDSFDPNLDHRYLNTVAKGIQFLSARSPEMIELRRDRAMKGGAHDVAEAYQYVLGLYDDFRVVQISGVV